MDAEELRDSILAVSGQLDSTMGGTLLASVAVSGPVRHRSVAATRRSTNRLGGAFICPSSAAPSMMCSRRSTFPIRPSSNGDRATTTVASQALS